MSIYSEIKTLLTYGLRQGLLDPMDEVYAKNRLLSILKLDAFEEEGSEVALCPFGEVQSVLDRICAFAVTQGIITQGVTQKDLFDAALMDCMMQRPSEIQSQFKMYLKTSSLAATDYFYQHSRASNYVRMERIKRNKTWHYKSSYGILDITINLSRPEKDPMSIVAESRLISVDYPKCLLCRENEGYAGHLNHPSRQNLRLIPIQLNKNEHWFLQYSPYEYYNEHCILFKEQHESMTISSLTFERLLDFVQQFPHYFIGSNADLPIVGGSILSHEHFQGGRYDFAMANARILHEQSDFQFQGVRLQTLFWPMSVLRLLSQDKNQLVQAATYVLNHWRVYNDESVDIQSHSDGISHNTITPIARFRHGYYEIDLVLRNNLVSEKHPLGIFHPHQEWHHIKKENIGLIEVMGLAILPERLEIALQKLVKCLHGELVFGEHLELQIHAQWFNAIATRYQAGDDAMLLLQQGVAEVFESILSDAGVFKQTEKGQTAFMLFIKSIS